ncbi:alpha/beta fold hydrolase [Nocardioides acrostichi]|uniref:Alpha/beta fold hydrolase n=1 Tax=Nocardioides acrostichi TaxID=2784339 RepID=A0A930YAN2_9ACTN|nr:alpha/beta fold hydrolase [Nocardioides acrostichi]MBF4161573.1 alpha/beta fold hydrolase [Nocardioides acrostichi]
MTSNAHTLEVNGFVTRYLTAGPSDAPVVLLVHDGAWGASAEVTWGEMMPLVARRYRVIAPDMLGFGGSAKAVQLDQSPYEFRARHLLALLDALEIDRPVHTIGNSFGGSVLLQAQTSPRWAPRFASVTSISGTGGPWRSARALSELGHFDGTAEDMRRILELVIDPYEGMEQQIADRLQWAAQPGHYASVVAPHTAVPETLRTERPPSTYPADLDGTGVPTLLVYGSRDDLVEPDWMERIVKEAPEVRTATLDTMHSPNISHPDLTWATIEPFLAEVEAAAR